MLTVAFDRFFDLRRQLARRREDQAADAGAAEFVLCAAAHGQLVQNWQHKSRCFASAGLGTCQKVVPCQHEGDGLRLNRSRRVITFFLHSFQKGRC